MKYNLKTFSLVAVLITTGLLLVDKLSGDLPDNLQGPASLLTLFLFLWVPFDLIVKVIYRFAAVPAGTKKLNHRQSEDINRYWVAWMTVAPISAVVFTLLFDRTHWQSTLAFGSVFMLLVLLSFLNRKNKLMGHTKKELFQ